MSPMIVLTCKADGGTQDVHGFYAQHELGKALQDAGDYLTKHGLSRRAIIRIELYNPNGLPPEKDEL